YCTAHPITSLKLRRFSYYALDLPGIKAGFT
ncbi:MAG: hypothetical protein ACI90V_012391, partial [Bacillariaceae sp.]